MLFRSVFGAISVINGHFSVGMLSSFLTYANQYTKPFNEISSVMSEMQTALAASQRVFDLLDEKEESAQNETTEINNVLGEVVLNNVYFSYDKNEPLIEDFNLKVKPGQTVAIVGKTGCGKTTLINLLMRFYDQNRGSIEIDGLNTLSIDRNSLRKMYGMVLQETWILDRKSTRLNSSHIEESRMPSSA